MPITLDEENAILYLEPTEKLTKEDFDAAVELVNPYIEKHGKLNGVIIATETFPGWKDFAALSRHFVFVKNHHQKVERLAFVTDSVIGDLAVHLAGHFVHAEIKHFPWGEKEAAKAWILEKV